MDVVVVLSVSGTLLSGLAAWFGLLSPAARAASRARADRDRRAREVHEALFGTTDRNDDSGALIMPGTSGVLADMRVVMAKLNAPLLNGKGDDLIRTVARIDGRVERLARRVSRIERRVDDPSKP